MYASSLSRSSKRAGSSKDNKDNKDTKDKSCVSRDHFNRNEDVNENTKTESRNNSSKYDDKSKSKEKQPKSKFVITYSKPAPGDAVDKMRRAAELSHCTYNMLLGCDETKIKSAYDCNKHKLTDYDRSAMASYIRNRYKLNVV